MVKKWLLVLLILVINVALMVYHQVDRLRGVSHSDVEPNPER